jgi:hypothetical protein
VTPWALHGPPGGRATTEERFAPPGCPSGELHLIVHTGMGRGSISRAGRLKTRAASVGLRLMELPQPPTGEARRPLLLDPAFCISPSGFGRWCMSSGRVLGPASGAAGDSHHGEHGGPRNSTEPSRLVQVVQRQSPSLRRGAWKFINSRCEDDLCVDGEKLGFMGGEKGGDSLILRMMVFSTRT